MLAYWSNDTFQHKEELVERMQYYLSHASAYAQEALKADVEFSDQNDYMLAAYGFTDALMRIVHGLLLELGYDVWADRLTTIQEAIDSARDGATVYVEPGIYSEALNITKSITIDGAYLDSRAPYNIGTAGFATIVQPENSGIGVHVQGTDPIQVTIRQIVIQQASQGPAFKPEKNTGPCRYYIRV